MTNYSYKLNNDYDKQLSVGATHLRYYSKEKIDELYPDGNYSIVGEMNCTVKNEKKQQSKKKSKKTPIGQTSIGNDIFEIFAFGAHGSSHKTVGFVCVGDDKFLIVKRSRIPFIATFSPMLFAIAACAVIIILLLLNPPQHEEGTLHPLPSIDHNIEAIDPAVTTNGTTEPDTPATPPEDGSGSVSLIYTMTATYNEGDDEISVYFKNPSKSNHDIVLELYAIATDGSRVLMAKSGRIPAGYGISKMTLLKDAPKLTKNTYKGLYKASYYNPTTGELATVNTEIPDISITVK